jgi:mono/diheme cytochrome c family protein
MSRRSWKLLVLLAFLVFDSAVALHVVSAQDSGRTKLTVTKRVYDTQQLLAKPQLSEEAIRGRAIWVQRCAYCHDGVGTPTYKTLGPWLDAETVKGDGEKVARQHIATGSDRMPGFRYTLLPEQVDELIALLKSVTPDQKPTASELAKSPPTEAPTQ